MDKLNVLVMFVVIVEIGSFSCGVECLGKMFLVLIKVVVYLEVEFGVCLFECIICSLVLIEVGQIYLEVVCQFLEMLCMVGQEIELLELELCGELCFVVLLLFVVVFFQQVCVSFFEVYLWISLWVDFDEIFFDFSEGGYDFGLCDGFIDLLGLVVWLLVLNQIVFCVSFVYLVW